MNKEEVIFNTNEDIIYQIEMMSYNKYNNKLANMNDYVGEIYSLRDIEDVEKSQIHYKKELSYKAIEFLQQQLDQANKKLDKIKELANKYGYYTLSEIPELLSIIGGE